MRGSLQTLRTLLARLKSSRTTVIALVVVLSLVAVLAMVMAFRAPAGEKFIGYWPVHDPVTGGMSTIHIYRTADGFEVQVSTPGVAPVPYLLKGGVLVPAPGYEHCSIISLVGKRLVMTPQNTESATPQPKAALAPTTTPTTTPTITPQPQTSLTQDPNAQQNGVIIQGIHTLQVAVQSWAVDHQNLYPTVDVVVSTGAFAAYLQSWPTNPVTGQPMAPGSGAGDYTYEQVNGGQGFKLTGYGVDRSAIITVP